MFKKPLMKKVSLFFSKVMFWFENVFFIIGMMCYEIMLIPYTYLKIGVNIMGFANLEYVAKYLPFWIVVGPFLLIVAASVDMYYFLKILLNYQENFKLKNIDNAQQLLINDKLIIYNEVIDVMKAILNMFTTRRKQSKRRSIK
jgi:hypothetical protein